MALSADLDGEPLGLSAPSMHGHLAACRGCAAWYEAVAGVTRTVRLSEAGRTPDLVAVVLPAVLPALRRPRRRAAVRAGLVVVGLVQAILAWPAVVLGQDQLTGMVHAAHETGAWSLALAVAFLGAAGRPSTAGALLSPLATFVGILAVSGALDAIAGAVPVQRLVTHLVAVAGVALLVAARRLDRLGEPTPGRRSGRWSIEGAAPTGPGLVLVTQDDQPHAVSARTRPAA